MATLSIGGRRRARAPGNIQKAAPVYVETEREIETETSGQRVRIDKTAAGPTRDFVERKLVGDSRYFPRELLAGYAASLRPIPPNILLERQNVHGRQVRVSEPNKLAGKRSSSLPVPMTSTMRARSTAPS